MKRVSVPQNGGTKYLISGYFGGGKLPLHKPYPYSLYTVGEESSILGI